MIDPLNDQIMHAGTKSQVGRAYQVRHVVHIWQSRRDQYVLLALFRQDLLARCHCGATLMVLSVDVAARG
jgi:hypothetical protein